MAFLARKWARELDYLVRTDLWTFGGNRIAVRYRYGWYDVAGQWWRSYGNENWEFADVYLLRRREAYINDLRIDAADRRIHAPRDEGDNSPASRWLDEEMAGSVWLIARVVARPGQDAGDRERLRADRRSVTGLSFECSSNRS